MRTETKSRTTPMTKIDTQRLRELLADLRADDPRPRFAGALEIRCANFLREHGPALLARIAELEAEREWRPIESAPKDGTRVLIYTCRGNPSTYEGVLIAEYVQTDDNGDRWWELDEGGRAMNPAGWKPLPEPPSLVPVAEVG